MLTGWPAKIQDAPHNSLKLLAFWENSLLPPIQSFNYCSRLDFFKFNFFFFFLKLNLDDLKNYKKKKYTVFVYNTRAKFDLTTRFYGIGIGKG